MNSSEIKNKRQDFHNRLKEANLLEGYAYSDGTEFITRPYWPLEPKNNIQPFLWKWEKIRSLILECGELIGLGRGSSSYDRRVIALSNPGTKHDYSMTGTLFGDIQLIKPNESAPCHRHTPSATRFIMEGSGGWTTVSGDRVHVQPGDIVHTGQFPWHDHGNSGTDDFIFLDMLDIPLLYFTATSSWEFDYLPITGSHDKVNQPTQVTDFQENKYIHTKLKPTFKTSWARNHADFSHLSWKENRSFLVGLGEEKGSDYDGIRCEFRTPSGHSIGNTVSVHTQWIRPQEKTQSHRHTGAFAFICIEGKGKVIIEDMTYEFGPKDIFVIPSWHWHKFESQNGCFLQSISDLALIQKMGLYREQRQTQTGTIIDSGWTSNTEPFIND